MIALHASRSLCRLAVIAIGLIGVTTTANAADPREKLFGMWKLVSGVSEELDTAKKTELWRPDAIGYITFVPEGRMMVLIANSGRGKPASAVPTMAEAESLFRSVWAAYRKVIADYPESAWAYHSAASVPPEAR